MRAAGSALRYSHLATFEFRTNSIWATVDYPSNAYCGNLYIVTHSMRIRSGTRDAVAVDVVELLTRDTQSAVNARGQCVLAVPDGSVKAAILPPFSLVELPWLQVHMHWVDDRVVPISRDDSNAGVAMTLIAHSPMARDAHIHCMSDTFNHLPLAVGLNNPNQL